MTVKLIALILPLGLDTFAVAAALGTLGLPARRRLRLAGLMALFEAGMPLIGLALGAPLGRALGAGADVVAIAVLIGFGLYTLLHREGSDEGARVRGLAAARGWACLALGVTISLDELAIGFTLGLLEAPVVLVIVLIGAQAFVAAQLGLWLGTRIGERWREGAERVAGLALTALGAGLLIEKLVGA